MRVYYDNPEEGLDHENAFTMLILQKMKYRLMWELRHLEEEINGEDGMIIVSLPGIQTKDFSEEVTDKIRSVMATIDWDKW